MSAQKPPESSSRSDPPHSDRSDTRPAQQDGPGVGPDAPRAAEVSASASASPPEPRRAASPRSTGHQRAALYWWLKLVLQPALFVLFAVGALAALGLYQRQFDQPGADEGPAGAAAAAPAADRFICPMNCIPPQPGPGRCSVCGMDLQPAPKSGGSAAGSLYIEIDPAARRVANIQTAEVTQTSVQRAIRAIGELSYDEGTMKTIAAYVPGRIERLYADYTGVRVTQGDQLALVYSPKLYSSQVEFLLAKKALESSAPSSPTRVVGSSPELYQSARQRLVEFGMSAQQIEQLQQAGEASSRLQLVAPISGTVIEKLAVDGQYVQEGQPIYRLADLTSLWLMLELFPDDAMAVRYGQEVEATVDSLPGRLFAGRVAFVDPNVDPRTRTVGVRVVIPNPDGQLRVGDYARADIAVPLTGQSNMVFDQRLAGKWISPRHPHVIRDQPGQCPLCGIDLVPAEEFGYSSEPLAEPAVLVVPRSAVLMAGDQSVVYVETQPGRFELRRVVLGPSLGGEIVILQGLKAGEQAAVHGNFLIDSQMQLAGNPSLIDPAGTPRGEATDPLPAKVREALASLPPADRVLAEAQRVCPVTGALLGSMGTPPKVDVGGRLVFICCEGCRSALLSDPEKYLPAAEEERP